MTTVETLRAARQLITNPDHFHQGGQYTNTTGTAYCAVGATMKAAGYECSAATPALPAEMALDRALLNGWAGEFVGEGRTARFNDDPETSHAEVLALFDRAIAVEEAREQEMEEAVLVA